MYLSQRKYDYSLKIDKNDNLYYFYLFIDLRTFFYWVNLLIMFNFYFCHSFLPFYPYYNNTTTHTYQCFLWKKRIFHLLLSDPPSFLVLMQNSNIHLSINRRRDNKVGYSKKVLIIKQVLQLHISLESKA